MSYPAVVLLLAIPLFTATVLFNVMSYLDHLRQNELPPGDDPQRAALCERSWKLTDNRLTGRGFGLDRSFQNSQSVWTFRNGELLAGHLNAINEYGEAGSNAPDHWTYTLEGGRLRIVDDDWWSKDSFDFQVVDLTPDKLVLEATSSYLKGKRLTFAGQPRVPIVYRNWPPMWLFVLAQMAAALGAHYLARRQPGRGARFSAYFLTHVLIAMSISALGLINPRDGAWAWLGQQVLVGGSILAAFVLGAIGGLIHMQSARKAAGRGPV